jgi:hypothetical protein
VGSAQSGTLLQVGTEVDPRNRLIGRPEKFGTPELLGRKPLLAHELTVACEKSVARAADLRQQRLGSGWALLANLLSKAVLYGSRSRSGQEPLKQR